MAVVAIGFLCASGAGADELRASIFAGSGAIGVSDGGPSLATFMMPTQLALDGSGNVFVVDTAAQRIRKIDGAGNVTTVAGGGPINVSGMWVNGSYADGPATVARFNRPDGIVVEPSGKILVADRDNHCIRAIVGATVTTFAGRADAAGKTDGAATQARFSSPRQMALDKDGTVYVADWGVGIRKISPNGSVVTINVTGATIDRPTGVTIGRSGTAASLFVADAAGIVRADLATLRGERFPSFPPQANAPGSISGDEPLGVPYGIAAFDVGDVVFTDLRDSSVKYVRLSSVLRHLGRTPQEDAMLTGGGAGSNDYDSPMGVAIGAKDVTYVADSGNRRIVRIAPFDRKRFVTSSDLMALSFPKNAYRVALLGSSFSWWGSGYDDSIAGFLSARLAGVPALAQHPPALRYFQISLLGEFDLIDSVLASGVADTVVMMLSPIDPYGLNKGADPAAWGPLVRQRLARSAAALKKAGIPLLVVINPGAQTIGPLESSFVFQSERADEATDYEREHAALLGVLAGIDVPLLDLYGAFRSEIARPDHRPLFNTANTHYSPYGRDFVAKAIFDDLIARRPWMGKP